SIRISPVSPYPVQYESACDLFEMIHMRRRRTDTNQGEQVWPVPARISFRLPSASPSYPAGQTGGGVPGDPHAGRTCSGSSVQVERRQSVSLPADLLSVQSSLEAMPCRLPSRLNLWPLS